MSIRNVSRANYAAYARRSAMHVAGNAGSTSMIIASAVPMPARHVPKNADRWRPNTLDGNAHNTRRTMRNLCV